MRDAAEQVGLESGLPVSPPAELLVVDRPGWVSGNVRTLRRVFTALPDEATDSRVVAWEAGLVLGVVARAVLAQYDPYRDVFLVVYPNLGEASHGDALRWIVYHEVTHLAQFRRAPWMREHILEVGNRAMRLDDPVWVREAAKRLARNLPELVQWARDALAGRATGATPFLELLPPGQRELVLQLHATLTLLEGHATHITDLIGRRVIPSYEQMQQRVRGQRRRPAGLRLLEAAVGLEMKREQYVLGRGFCEAVWATGGAAALAPAWERAENLPRPDELRDPDAWLARVS